MHSNNDRAILQTGKLEPVCSGLIAFKLHKLLTAIFASKMCKVGGVDLDNTMVLVCIIICS